MKMEKTIYNIKRLGVTKVMLATVFFTALTLGGCDKITDLQPNNSFSEETAFSSAARAELAMTGVYDAAQSGFYAGGAVRGYPFGAANTEQGDMRGEDMMNVATFFALTYEGLYDVTTANNQYQWETLFSLVNRANVVIEGVQAAGAANTIAAAKAIEYEAEAKFLRAMAYQELLVHFARPYDHTAGATHPGVPYRTVAVNTPAKVDEAKSQGRNTVKECYDKMIEDLSFAEANLPPTRTGALKVSRATKGAAIALKVRAYLNMGNWAQVIAESDKIVQGATAFTSSIGGYALTASPNGPFATPAANLANTESMFSIENASTDNPGTNGAIGQMYSKSPGRGLVAISPIIWNAPFWKANDLRRTQLATNNGRAYFTTKYTDYVTFTDANPIIRYSEVLLSRAEAFARITPLDPRALALLNAVRNRAVTSVTDQFTIASFISGNSLIQSILDERRIEFLAEGRRWADIHRLANDPVFNSGGVPAKVAYTGTTFASWNATTPYAGSRSITAIPYSDFRFVWPIPQTETSSNEVLKEQQNPGY